MVIILPPYSPGVPPWGAPLVRNFDQARAYVPTAHELWHVLCRPRAWAGGGEGDWPMGWAARCPVVIGE